MIQSSGAENFTEQGMRGGLAVGRKARWGGGGCLTGRKCRGLGAESECVWKRKSTVECGI